jgi:hypothetical protein
MTIRVPGGDAWTRWWIAGALLLLALAGAGTWVAREAAAPPSAVPAAGAARQAPIVGTAREGRTESRPLELAAGTVYQIGGQCDTSCSDLDLRLYAGDSLVAEDVGPTETPSIRYAPPRPGRFTLRVYAARCAREACGFKIGVRAVRRGPSPTDSNPRLAGVAPERSSKWPAPAPASISRAPASLRLEPAVRRPGDGAHRVPAGDSSPDAPRIDPL